MSNVVVTGAGGFIGAALVNRLLADGVAGTPVKSLVAVDLQLDALPADPRIVRVQGSIADPALLQRLGEQPLDVVFHLASVPGGAAERNPTLGRSVNLDATANWLQWLGSHAQCPRFVYASSIAVYGESLGTVVDDDTPPAPSLSYGAHKWIGEILVADATRRGWVQGCSLRLPGIVARPGPSQGLISSFMSEVFWALAQGRPVTLPVRPEGTAWWLSAQACVDNLLRAAAFDAARLGPGRSCLMPAQWLSMQSVVDALAQRFGEPRRTLVTYAPDEQVQRLFASFPPLHTPKADALGLRHDGSAAGLVSAALGVTQ